MIVSLGREFSDQLFQLIKSIEFWRTNGVATLKKNFRIIGQLVKGEAQKRVPVKSNRLKQGILTVTFEDASGIVTDIGTNVKSKTGHEYPVTIEFGNKYIAEGRVLALGDGINISDSEAIKDWPAKRERQAENQQMPYLRPAWKKVEPSAIKLINDGMEPPRQK